jgi:hypothetical protein
LSTIAGRTNPHNPLARTRGPDAGFCFHELAGLRGEFCFAGAAVASSNQGHQAPAGDEATAWLGVDSGLGPRGFGSAWWAVVGAHNDRSSPTDASVLKTSLRGLTAASLLNASLKAQAATSDPGWTPERK